MIQLINNTQSVTIKKLDRNEYGLWSWLLKDIPEEKKVIILEYKKGKIFIVDVNNMYLALGNCKITIRDKNPITVLEKVLEWIANDEIP